MPQPAPCLKATSSSPTYSLSLPPFFPSARPQKMIIWTTLSALFLLAPVHATLTVYTATPTTTATAALLSYTPASADQTYLQAPSPPEGQAASVAIQLYDGGMTGMGLPVVSAPPSGLVLAVAS